MHRSVTWLMVAMDSIARLPSDPPEADCIEATDKSILVKLILDKSDINE